MADVVTEQELLDDLLVLVANGFVVADDPEDPRFCVTALGRAEQQLSDASLPRDREHRRDGAECHGVMSTASESTSESAEKC